MNIQKINKFFQDPKRRYFTFGVSIFFIVLSFILLSDHGLIKRIMLENHKSELNESIINEMKNKDSLKKVIQKLQTDTIEIERIAREKYGMVKPGEEVFFVKKKKKD